MRAAKPIEERFLRAFVHAAISARQKKRRFIRTEKTFGVPKSPELQIQEHKPALLIPPTKLLEDSKTIISTQPRNLYMPQKLIPRARQIQSTPLQPLPAPAGGSAFMPAKLAPFLKDPAVSLVECPGPGKQVLITRGGLLQVTPLTLTAEDIQQIMAEISKETRIPLLQGLFKAALTPFIITAVISENIGTRFVIEKRRLQASQAIVR
ncbi:hypothetical protein HYZ97_03510 [Candidatus Pacearchaeota archaeon]|nr:hypothetical protein [Candidatus Pacearchaeota archaeon]